MILAGLGPASVRKTTGAVVWGVLGIFFALLGGIALGVGLPAVLALAALGETAVALEGLARLLVPAAGLLFGILCIRASRRMWRSDA